MEASLLIRRESKDDFIFSDAIFEHLERMGVRAGINEELVQRIASAQLFDMDLIVAEGALPVAGENGRIEYYFEPHPKITPQVNPDGSVDYTNVNILQRAEPGQILAKLLPPTQGTPGYDIAGTMLPAVAGKPSHLPRGKNTTYVDAAGTVLKSDVHGHVRLNPEGSIEVATLYMVAADVDYNIGSVDFPGDIIVQGDVLSGFSLKASGEIEIKGVVEDAVISAGGSVVVRGGFAGSGKGSIEAGANVFVRYVHHQSIIAGNDIVVANEAIGARMQAGRSIQMTGGAGVLAGGVAEAALGVECKNLGTIKQTRTEVNITVESEAMRRITELKSLLQVDRKSLDKLEATLKQMEKVDNVVHRISAQRQQLYPQLYESQYDLKIKIEDQEKELRQLEAAARNQLDELYVKVHRVIFPGVHITIAGSQLDVFEQGGKCLLKLRDSAVTEVEFK